MCVVYVKILCVVCMQVRAVCMQVRVACMQVCVTCMSRSCVRCILKRVWCVCRNLVWCACQYLVWCVCKNRARCEHQNVLCVRQNSYVIFMLLFSSNSSIFRHKIIFTSFTECKLQAYNYVIYKLNLYIVCHN